MKKKILSLVLCFTLVAGALCTTDASASFTDVNDSSLSYAAAVLQSIGIIDGYGDGTFRPSEYLTRVQFCKIAVMAMGLGGQVTSYSRKTLFTDTEGGQWFTGYVNLAYTKGVINGYGDGTFGPNDTVSYGQAVTIIIRMLGYTSSDVGALWPADYVSFSDDIGLSNGTSLSADDKLTRGDAALLILNMLRADTASGKSYASMLTESCLTSVIVLSNSATADDGTTGCARIYSSGGTAYYSQAITIPQELVGSKGTVLLDSSGKVCGFVPDSTSASEITATGATSGKLTAKNGSSYNIDPSASLIYQGERYAYSTKYINIKSGSTVRLYFDANGSVETVYIPGATSDNAAVAASSSGILNYFVSALSVSGEYTLYKNGSEADAGDLAQYDVATYDASGNSILVSDRRVTGTIEAVYPSMDAPTTVTVAGSAYSVLECARDDFGSYSLGKTVTLLLTSDGMVASAGTGSAYKADMVGVLSKSGSGYTVTLPGGIMVSGVSSSSVDGKYVGTLVKASSTGVGKISVSPATSSDVYGKLVISDGTIGSYKIAPGAQIYEWVGSGYVTEISLSDITWTDTLSSSYVSYAHLNSAGQVDILLLNDVTGNSYTYGIATAAKQESGTFSTSVSTLSVTNSAGSTDTLTGGSGIRNNSFAGVAATAAGAVAKAVSLKSVEVDRDDLYGEAYAEIDGTLFPIAENVQVYNSTASTWYTNSESKGTALEQALAYSGSLTLYYDRTAETGGMIRVITVE